MAMVLTLIGDEFPRTVQEYLVTNAYSLDFLIVDFGQLELFTEQTPLHVLQDQATAGELARRSR